MLKNYLRYFLPATLVLLLAFAYGLANNIQSWQSQATGSPVATVDSLGGLNIVGSGAFNYSAPASMVQSTSTANVGAVTGGSITNSGWVDVSMPLQGTYDKKLVISVSGCTVTGNTLAITFPTPFTMTPGTLCNSVDSGGTTGLLALVPATSAGITGGTLNLDRTGAATGQLILEGP